VGTLSGNGPFTVFAPVNSAFDKLPQNVPTLLKAENKVSFKGSDLSRRAEIWIRRLL